MIYYEPVSVIYLIISALRIYDSRHTDFVLQIDDFMVQVYYMYKRSAKKWHELQKIAGAMDDIVLKPVRATGTRWLDHRKRAMAVGPTREGLYLW